MTATRTNEINLIDEELAAFHLGLTVKQFRRNRALMGIKGFRCGDEFFFLETTVDRYIKEGADLCNGVDHLRYDMHQQYLIQINDDRVDAPFWEDLEIDKNDDFGAPESA